MFGFQSVVGDLTLMKININITNVKLLTQEINFLNTKYYIFYIHGIKHL